MAYYDSLIWPAKARCFIIVSILLGILSSEQTPKTTETGHLFFLQEHLATTYFRNF